MRRSTALVCAIGTAIVAPLATLSANPVAARTDAARSAVTAPSALTATAASRSTVSLGWTNSGPAATKIVVERRVLGAPWPIATTAAAAAPAQATAMAIATVDGASYTDATIDPYTTYVYRLRGLSANVLSAPSNEITVGPPPVGFSQVLAAPKAMHTHDPSQFANLMRMTFDANGDPAVAYLTYDLNNDGERPDTDLSVITWNRARYRWNAPVSVDTIGNVSGGGTHIPFAIARDESTGKYALLYVMGEHELRIATSDNAGQTWTHVSVQRSGPDDPGFSIPSLVMAGGRVYAAYGQGSNSVRFRTGLLTDAPAKWAEKIAPKVGNSGEPRSDCVSVILDAAGKPAVSYCLEPTSAYNLIVALWRPESGATVKITDSNNHQNDDPGLQIASVGNEMAAAFYGSRDDAFFANHHIWFSRSRDNGVSWSSPVAIADDGGNAMGAPVSVMIDRAGHFAISAPVVGGNEGSVVCGQPKLARSSDGTKWTTCAPDTKGVGAVADPGVPTGAFAGNDKLYMAFKTRAAVGAVLPGIVLWRER